MTNRLCFACDLAATADMLPARFFVIRCPPDRDIMAQNSPGPMWSRTYFCGKRLGRTKAQRPQILARRSSLALLVYQLVLLRVTPTI